MELSDLRFLQTNSTIGGSRDDRSVRHGFEFVAFLLWYIFLIICCVLPTCCAYRRRRWLDGPTVPTEGPTSDEYRNSLFILRSFVINHRNPDVEGTRAERLKKLEESLKKTTFVSTWKC